MSGHPGLYSLIQFCPDAQRAEGVNVGVVIVCESLARVVTKFSASNDLVRRRLGAGAFHEKALSSAKQALEVRLRQLPANGSAFRQWMKGEAGRFAILEPRDMVVRDLEADLSRLFDRLVAEGSGAPVQEGVVFIPGARSQGSGLQVSMTNFGSGNRAPESMQMTYNKERTQARSATTTVH